MKYRILFVIAINIMATVRAEAQDVNQLLYDAYVQRSVDNWKKALEIRKAETTKSDLAFAYFSMLHGSLSVPDEALFDDHVDDAKKLLNTLIEANPKSGVYPAMLGNIYGDAIGYRSIRGMSVGYKAGTLAAKGIQLEPASPLTWYVFAVNKYYAPSAFGGNYKEAEKALLKSIGLMEANAASNKQNWMYLDALMLLGNTQLKLDNKSAAIEAYNKALAYEPKFEYAKVLLRTIPK